MNDLNAVMVGIIGGVVVYIVGWVLLAIACPRAPSADWVVKGNRVYGSRNSSSRNLITFTSSGESRVYGNTFKR